MQFCAVAETAISLKEPNYVPYWSRRNPGRCEILRGVGAVPSWSRRNPNSGREPNPGRCEILMGGVFWRLAGKPWGCDWATGVLWRGGVRRLFFCWAFVCICLIGVPYSAASAARDTLGCLSFQRQGSRSQAERDGYYRKAKAMGFRARSAFKLLQLDEEFGFLSDPSTTRVVDLCACPGSWSQVIERKLEFRRGAVIVAVDVQSMRPLAGVQQLCGDITRHETLLRILHLLNTTHPVSNALTRDAAPRSVGVSEEVGGCEGGRQEMETTSRDEGQGDGSNRAYADVIVCDGAPDVTGLHDLDMHLAQQLVLAALGLLELPSLPLFLPPSLPPFLVSARLFRLPSIVSTRTLT